MLSEAEFGTTELAFQGNNNRYAGDKHLLIQFHILPMPDHEKSAEEGRPIYKDVEHVRIMQPGNKDSIVDRPVTDMDKERFSQQYEAWKTKSAEVLEGTPLEAWPAVTRSQVEELKYFNIRTVEQLANVSDSNAQKFMGVQMLKRHAQAFLEASKENSMSTKMVAELEQRDNQIAALQQAIADLQAKVAEKATKRPGPPPRAAKA